MQPILNTTSHFGQWPNSPSITLTIYFHIFSFSPLWLAKLDTQGFNHHEPVLVCALANHSPNTWNKVRRIAHIPYNPIDSHCQ